MYNMRVRGRGAPARTFVTYVYMIRSAVDEINAGVLFHHKRRKSAPRDGQIPGWFYGHVLRENRER